LADKVRALLPDGNFFGIIEQLDRFGEFVELTVSSRKFVVEASAEFQKSIDLSCITNIIQSLKIVNGQ
jgi:hypothetical protein